ncbi:pyridoxal phosphate-dependent decarboxylase family protein [Phenylobacterium sp.]|uniref:pyridoxal phosphate-dependent decarboxylase family protein n=1 Tax=Phenylobacterium sp. TaxID=1871053 RepID=UPI002E36A40D|nr:pyridoxal-dependent decarboxylase [Phenylobacterium sp.]HEX3366062.1 pyridoxal-dependent decarboxylase [Phenylobacterium sp.]
MKPLFASALRRALDYRQGVGAPDQSPPQSLAEAIAAFSGPTPEAGEPALQVIDALDRLARPGLRELVGPRFFGWVIGASHPVGVAADWLTSAWGQNAGNALRTPAASAAVAVAGKWLLDLQDLPREASVGFVTGATLANFVGLAAARGALLRNAGWYVEADGLFGAPPIEVLIGDDAHATVFAALRYLGLGERRVTRLATDTEGRILPEALAAALDDVHSPPLLILQAGQLHTGAFDPAARLIPQAKAKGAWVHLDGAFGLWARACPSRADLAAGFESADSWATDGHKWLQTPYDCGYVIVRDADAHRRAMGITASYLPVAGAGERDPSHFVPEQSRRAWGFATWAMLRHLGRSGIAALVERHCRIAARMAERLSREPGVSVLNDVGLNQVAVRFGPAAPGAVGDRLTLETVRRIQADNQCFAGEARWRARAIMRLSVSSMATTPEEAERACDAILAAWRAVRES